MKKIIYILSIATAALLASCNQDLLETAPTDQVSGETIFANAEAAQVAVNGIYRAMRVNSWSSGWAAENPGVLSMPLVFDLMGEDHYMATQGNGWFYYDYGYNVDSDYTSTSGRQYAQWNLGFTMVSQANYVIAASEKISGSNSGKNVLAQAYAIRAFAYMYLSEFFCQGNYTANKDTPGVPIYTKSTDASTKGAARGKLSDVYAQINADYAEAVKLFTEAGIAQSDASHIDLYTTYVLWARVLMAEGDFESAYQKATLALGKPDLTRVATLAALGNFNNVAAKDVLWGFTVIADQTGPYGPFHTHMDPVNGGYGKGGHQCADAWLYASIPATDGRKAWWIVDSGGHPVQYKFLLRDVATSVADVIMVRAEEAILIAAEAAIRKTSPDFAAARTLLTELMAKRDDAYAARLATYTNSANYGTDTKAAPTTLMEEILWERRVELWCEGMGRLYDLRRLNLGFTRTYAGSTHPRKLARAAGHKQFTTLIPQKEFDSNDNMDSVADQNPR